MKRFLALWVVTIVLGAIAGFALGVVDYIFAELRKSSSQLIGGGSVETPCWKTIMGIIEDGCYSDKIVFLGIYPIYSLFITVPGYILIRVVVGSFKLVFSDVPNA